MTFWFYLGNDMVEIRSRWLNQWLCSPFDFQFLCVQILLASRLEYFLNWLAVWFKWCFKLVLARAKEFGRATKLPWLSNSLNTAKQLVLWGDSLMERFPRNNDLSWAFLAWDPARVPLVSSGPRDPAGQEHPWLPVRWMHLCSLFSSHWSQVTDFF